MSNLPKYYFQDIPSAVMEQIVQAMMASKPELEFEDMDDFLNRNNHPATVPAWYERAEEFLSSR